MEAIFERVKEVIGEQLGIDDLDSITLDTTFIDDLGADSLDIVELIMALEKNLIWKFQKLKQKRYNQLMML